MQTFLSGVYQLLSVMLFLFLSAVLLYHHRFKRWLWFTVSYFTIYVLGCFFFFGRAPAYFPADLAAFAKYWLEVGSVLLLVFGFFAVLGYSLLSGHNARQQMGAVLIFLALMGAMMTVIYITVGYGALSAGAGG